MEFYHVILFSQESIKLGNFVKTTCLFVPHIRKLIIWLRFSFIICQLFQKSTGGAVVKTAILTSKLQPSNLKGNKAISNLYDVNQSIEVVWS